MQNYDRRTWLREALEPAAGMAVHDHAAWEDEFHVWVVAGCMCRRGYFQSIGSLHIDFCEWLVRARSVPCTRGVFDKLIDDAGLLVVDGMVNSLMLRSDYRRLCGL